MLQIAAIVVIVLIVALLAFAATRPDTFRLQREAEISALPEKMFAQIDDFHNWGAWSPWEKIDPAVKRTFSGATSGRGAIYEWEGNKKVGMGRMEITDSAPYSKITIKLDFLKPFEAHNITEFTLHRRGDSTHIEWAMFGPSPFMSKLMTIFVSMDKMVGKDFESGLANLKRISEQ
ncbi:MAG: SRPBCC family protein [Betaproteobacteria bacterium]|nr:SRPBCC family protein [Betaproteobacteria bacterium]